MAARGGFRSATSTSSRGSPHDSNRARSERHTTSDLWSGSDSDTLADHQRELQEDETDHAESNSDDRSNRSSDGYLYPSPRPSEAPLNFEPSHTGTSSTTTITITAESSSYVENHDMAGKVTPHWKVGETPQGLTHCSYKRNLNNHAPTTRTPTHDSTISTTSLGDRSDDPRNRDTQQARGSMSLEQQ